MTSAVPLTEMLYGPCNGLLSQETYRKELSEKAPLPQGAHLRRLPMLSVSISTKPNCGLVPSSGFNIITIDLGSITAFGFHAKTIRVLRSYWSFGVVTCNPSWEFRTPRSQYFTLLFTGSSIFTMIMMGIRVEFKRLQEKTRLASLSWRMLEQARNGDPLCFSYCIRDSVINF